MPVCCRDNPDIGFLRFIPAHTPELPHLNKSKQFWLKDGADFTDLVKKKRSPVRQFYKPLVHSIGIGERPLLVPEEFTLNQGIGYRGATERNEGLVCSLAVLVEEIGEQFLPGSTRSLNENR